MISNSDITCFYLDSNTGTLRLWSVSSESPILHFKVKDTGFNSLHSISTSRTVQSEDVSKSQYDSFSISSSSNKYEVPPVKIVSVFKDGGVGLYDLKKKSWDFLREKVLDLFTLIFSLRNFIHNSQGTANNHAKLTFAVSCR